jgi:hypothetical protein
MPRWLVENSEQMILCEGAVIGEQDFYKSGGNLMRSGAKTECRNRKGAKKREGFITIQLFSAFLCVSFPSLRLKASPERQRPGAETECRNRKGAKKRQGLQTIDDPIDSLRLH